jgi:hypothetical protein
MEETQPVLYHKEGTVPMGVSLEEQHIGVGQSVKRRGKGATLMSSDVASDERLQSLLLLLLLLFLHSPQHHTLQQRESATREPSPFALMEETQLKLYHKEGTRPY